MAVHVRRGLAAAFMALLPLAVVSLSSQAQTVPLYHVGSHGPEVAILQQDLQDLGYHPGGITGRYTLKTRDAVRLFQDNHGLSADGIVGPRTKRSLTHAMDGAFHRVWGVMGAFPLQSSDEGRAVLTLQQDLAKLGCYAGAPDGVYNALTAQAVKDFNLRHGLGHTGSAGLATLRAVALAIHGEDHAQVSQHKTTTVQTTAAASLPTAIAHASSPMVLGYYVPGQAAWADLVAHASQITAIAPLWYSFKPTGPLNDLGASAAVTSWAHARHIAVYPIVINGYGNDNMLQNAALMQQDVATLVSLAETAGYDGFNIDFESLNNPDETGLDTFVAELAAGLHQEGKKLIVSVGPRTSSANGYHVYNYESLGSSADYVDLMLYDAHDNTGAPGPVAPLAWSGSIVRYAEATMPASKILVGLASYGYDWASTGSVEINDNQALSLAHQYGSTWVGGSTQEPEVVYTVNGVTHTVWFEDSASEAYKAVWVAQDHLGGVALWDLGEENAGVWPMLQSTLP